MWCISTFAFGQMHQQYEIVIHNEYEEWRTESNSTEWGPLKPFNTAAVMKGHAY